MENGRSCPNSQVTRHYPTPSAQANWARTMEQHLLPQSFSAAGRRGSRLLYMHLPLASASIRLETLASAVVSSGLSSPPPWGEPLCKSHVKTTAMLPPLSAIKLPRNVPYHTIVELAS